MKGTVNEMSTQLKERYQVACMTCGRRVNVAAATAADALEFTYADGWTPEPRPFPGRHTLWANCPECSERAAANADVDVCAVCDEPEARNPIGKGMHKYGGTTHDFAPSHFHTCDHCGERWNHPTSRVACDIPDGEAFCEECETDTGHVCDDDCRSYGHAARGAK